MKKWIGLGLIAFISLPSIATDDIDLRRLSIKENPASMRYYVEHYKNIDSSEYQSLMVSVRVAADTIDLYTTRLDARNQRIDYCLPMVDSMTRESLDKWETEKLMVLLSSRIDLDPRLKKYGKAGIGGSIGSHLVAALKAQYPCPTQKQL